MIEDALEAGDPRPLYVRRNLKNAADLVAWARAAGFKTILPPEEMHVTLAYSKAPVDWSAIAPDDEDLDKLDAGGPRSIERLGDEGAVALRFKATELDERWAQLRAAGAEWKYPSYKPHVTITYDAGDLDLAKVAPYGGPLEFGPEIFEEPTGSGTDKAKAAMVSTDAILAALDKAPPWLLAHPRGGAVALALDRESVRRFDKDGRLHVDVANVCKASVCPYRGKEIPGWQALGLDPDRVYQLLRDPEELEKAAPTLNGVPLLRQHVPVSAEDHRPYDVVGALGTSAEWSDPYVRNGLTIWPAADIKDVESKAKRELSPSYHYRPDMTPGKFGDKDFHGVMRDIVFNHVALVEDGRQGPDIIVGDSAEGLMADNNKLAKQINAFATRTGTMTAIYNHLRPRLTEAGRKSPLGLAMAFDSVTGANFAAKKADIVKVIREKAKPLLARDADLEKLPGLMDTLEAHEKEAGDESVSQPQHNAMEAAAHGQSNLDIPKAVGEEYAEADKGKTFDAAPLMNFLKSKGMGGDDLAAIQGMLPKAPGATDESDEDKKKREEEEKRKLEMGKDTVTKTAMDEAIKSATASVRAQMQGVTVALAKVRPIVGELSPDLAFDSAAAVYRHVLKMKAVPNAGTLHEDALLPILETLPKPGARPPSEPHIAQDADTTKNFFTRFEGADRIRPA